MHNRKTLVFCFLLAFLLSHCSHPSQETKSLSTATTSATLSALDINLTSTIRPWAVPTHNPLKPYITPTPDAPRVLPTLRTEHIEYVVQSGDTLGAISSRYTLPISEIVKTNHLENPDLITAGMKLILPPPRPDAPGPGARLIPDSELVRSPSSISFNLAAFVNSTPGYLRIYHEEISENVVLSGTEIIAKVSHEFSVHPRILLAWLEYQGNWITNPHPTETQIKYPAGLINSNYRGLYRQMAWAANSLSQGYYLWRINGVTAWILPDNSIIPPDPQINAGTAGIQQICAQLFDQPEWRQAVSTTGFIQTYRYLFGESFDYAYEPLIPKHLSQPAMQLPFEKNADWSFTGGPHYAWGSGSAWAALDFAPSRSVAGCVQSDVWVTAVSGGYITYSENGLVIQDLYGDHHDETGWSVIYLHIETRDRIAAGTTVKAGDRIGHPSCEGGISNGTHVHIARRYNGEWISADQTIPFVLDGWVSKGTGVLYNGYLIKDELSVEAWDQLVPENQIKRK